MRNRATVLFLVIAMVREPMGLAQDEAGQKQSESRACLANTATVPTGAAARLLARGLPSEVVRLFREAWERVERGKSNHEAAVLLTEESDGTYTADLRYDQNRYQSIRLELPPRVIAIFHTHPDSTSELPSAQDKRNSERLGVPNFTLTSRGVWVYDPTTGKTNRLVYLLNWLRDESWQPRRIPALGSPGCRPKSPVPESFC